MERPPDEPHSRTRAVGGAGPYAISPTNFDLAVSLRTKAPLCKVTEGLTPRDNPSVTA